MRIPNEQKTSTDLRLMSPDAKDFNLTVSIYMSRVVVERIVTIVLIFVFGLPLSFCTAWFASKQASSLLPIDSRSESPNNPNHNIN